MKRPLQTLPYQFLMVASFPVATYISSIIVPKSLWKFLSISYYCPIFHVVEIIQTQSMEGFVSKGFQGLLEGERKDKLFTMAWNCVFFLSLYSPIEICIVLPEILSAFSCPGLGRVTFFTFPCARFFSNFPIVLCSYSVSHLNVHTSLKQTGAYSILWSAHYMQLNGICMIYLRIHYLTYFYKPGKIIYGPFML